MTKRNIRLGLMALGVIAGLASTSARAEWTFNTNGTLAANGTTAQANSNTNKYAAGTANDPSVSLSGFFIGNATSTVGSVTTITGTSGPWVSSSNVVATGGSDNAQGLANMGSYGQGMYTGSDNGTPYHAIDNNQNTEGVLMSFGSAVTLKSVGLGYASNLTTENCVVSSNTGCYKADSATTGIVTVDVAVYRWAGTDGKGGGTATVAGLGSSLTGWELVGVYDMRTDSSPTYNLNGINAGNKTSSWWLITAYNSGLSGQSAFSSTSNNGDDYFKLLGVAGTKCTLAVGTNGSCGGSSLNLPEPATLALSSVALVGVAGLRRRKAKLAA